MKRLLDIFQQSFLLSFSEINKEKKSHNMYPKFIDEGFHELITIDTEENALNVVISTIEKFLKSGQISPDEYIMIEDDGITVGDEYDFDADALYYAIKADDIIDFDEMDIFDYEPIKRSVHMLFV